MQRCRYFDGQASRPRPATVTKREGGIQIVGDGVDRSVPPSDWRFAPATDRGPARLSFASGGLCEFDDRVAADALFAELGFRKPHADRLASRTSYAIGIAVAFVVVMAVIYQWGVPWASDAIVTHLPRAWDHALGDKLLTTLDARGLFRPTGLSEEQRDRILDRYTSLRMADGRFDARWPKTEIVFRRLGAPNALALPGDIIVVGDELVVLAGDDDAVMTVLAHETGHLEHRDAMRQLVRSTMTSVIAAWYIGDVSNAAALIAGGIGSLRYSREAEHGADLYALDMMKANGISTRSAAELFRRLQVWTPAPQAADASGKSMANDRDRRHIALPRIPEYLSTHPATEDRVELFERGVAPNDAR